MRSGHNVRSTVFIEARAMHRADGPEEMRPVGEVEFVPCARCRHLFDLRPR
jgi:L-fuconolactonase